MSLTFELEHFLTLRRLLRYARIVRDLDLLELNEREAAISILQLLCCSKRRLRVVEVIRLISIEAGTTAFEIDRFLRRDLLDICGPVLEIRSGCVDVVHFSARE